MFEQPSLGLYRFNPEIKAIGRLTRRQRVQYHRQMELIRVKYQRVMRSNLKTAFGRQMDAVIALDEPTYTDINMALLDSKPLFEQIYMNLYTRIADDIYPMVEKTSTVKSSWMLLETKGTDLYYRSHMLDWIQRNCAANISHINSTTMEQVSKIFSEADNTASFRDKVMLLFDGSIKPYRANAIARTETAAASNRASFETLKSTGFEGVKIWGAVLDMDTRDTHSSLDGTRVDRDETFQWTGEYGYVQMDVPADGTHGAPAGEIINCRCDVLFEYE